MKLLLVSLCVIGLILFWFLLADRFFLGPPVIQSVTAASINQGKIVIGSRNWPLGEHPPVLFIDQSARVVLYNRGQSFTFGPLTKRWEAAVEFLPDSGDTVSFTRRISRSVLPTRYFGYLNFLGASAPKWRRDVYDRLQWIKTDGSALDIQWRDEQRLWPTGWQDEYNPQVTDLAIQLSQADQAATAYLASKKKWQQSEYRLESRGGGITAAIYLEDENAPHPGAGRSVLLKLNQGKVVGETAWQ